jgi:glucan phosphoethanolaminetransferase (alkaline phosphatase superfamily)
MAFLLGVGGVAGLLFARGGAGATGLPGGYSVAAYAVLSIYEHATAPVRIREDVALGRSDVPVDFDIVLVIDESVRGDYLDINHPDGVYSGLGVPPDNANVLNLGLAASATNCSVGSNLVLRFGGTREGYQEQIWRIPSIWQYAKAADLQTIYIDAQSEHRFFNGMNDRELEDIDEIIQFHAVEPLYRDHSAARALIGKLNDNTPQLIVMNKLGPHFPIHDKYPADQTFYKPVLERGNFVEVAVSGRMPELFDGDWEGYKNSYKNTLVWTIGRFFDLLFQEASFANAVVVYTADHGQYFHERGEPGLRTHCEPGQRPAAEEGVVPLVLIYGGNLINEAEVAAIKERYNKASHYSVLPTLLELMHFDTQGAPNYHAPLNRVDDDPYTFNARFYARFGLRPNWVRIRLDSLEGPDGDPVMTRPVEGRLDAARRH